MDGMLGTARELFSGAHAWEGRAVCILHTPMSCDKAAAAILVDVDAHDLVERALGRKAELPCPPRLHALRPALDDAGDQRIAGIADARGHPLAGNAPQGRDLL